MNVFLLRTASLIFIAASAWAQPPGTGEISGTVVSDDGTAIRDCFVSYVRLPMIVGDKAGDVTTTDRNGAYQFSRLVSGKYILCARPTSQTGLVETCEWTTQPLTVTLGIGQALGGLQIVMERGARVEVRLDDPGQILANRATQKTGTDLSVGVWDWNGFFHALRPMGFDAGGQDMALTIPHEKRVRLYLKGKDVTVRDDKGARLPDSGSIEEFQTSRGTATRQFRFSITADR